MLSKSNTGCVTCSQRDDGQPLENFRRGQPRALKRATHLGNKLVQWVVVLHQFENGVLCWRTLASPHPMRCSCCHPASVGSLALGE